MKKQFAIFSTVLLCACICVVLAVGYRWYLFGGSRTETADTAPPDLIVAITPSPHYTPVNTESGFASLTTDDQRAVYEAIVRRIASVTDEPTGDKYTNSSGYFMQRLYTPRLGAQELAMVIDCVREDHPEAFWLTGNCRHGTNENGQYFIQPISYLSDGELDSAIAGFHKSVSEALASVPPGLDEFERELYLHDWLVEHCRYDAKGYDADKNDIHTGSAYGAFVGGETVCEGYARGFQLLLRMVGIESGLVTGTSTSPLNSSGRAHIWNTVEIDGAWYMADVTWDDSFDEENSRDYLNLTTDQISKDHAFDPLFSLEAGQESSSSDEYYQRSNRPYPACAAKAANYYVKKAAAVENKTQQSMDRIASALVEAIRNGAGSISVRLSDGEDKDTLQKWLTQYAFFRSARDANSTLGHKVLSENEVYYTRSETLDNVLIFRLPLLANE